MDLVSFYNIVHGKPFRVPNSQSIAIPRSIPALMACCSRARARVRIHMTSAFIPGHISVGVGVGVRVGLGRSSLSMNDREVTVACIAVRTISAAAADKLAGV